MLRILRKMRTQAAVYWAYLGPDRFNQPTFGNPVEIRVRWEDTTVVFMTDKNQEQVSKARVWLDETVTPEVPIKKQGVLWKGTLASLDTDHRAKPFLNANAWQIAKIDEIPTLKGTQFIRRAYL